MKPPIKWWLLEKWWMSCFEFHFSRRWWMGFRHYCYRPARRIQWNQRRRTAYVGARRNFRKVIYSLCSCNHLGDSSRRGCENKLALEISQSFFGRLPFCFYRFFEWVFNPYLRYFPIFIHFLVFCPFQNNHP